MSEHRKYPLTLGECLSMSREEIEKVEFSPEWKDFFERRIRYDRPSALMERKRERIRE